MVWCILFQGVSDNIPNSATAGDLKVRRVVFYLSASSLLQATIFSFFFFFFTKIHYGFDFLPKISVNSCVKVYIKWKESKQKIFKMDSFSVMNLFERAHTPLQWCYETNRLLLKSLWLLWRCFRTNRPFWRQLCDGCEDVSEQTGLFEDNFVIAVKMFQNKQAFSKTTVWWMWWCFRTNRPFWRQICDGCGDVSEQTGLFEDNCLMDVMMFQNKQAFLKTTLWWMWWCFRANRPFWRQLCDGCDDVSEQTGLFEDNCLMDVMMFQNKQAFLKTTLWWVWWCFRTNRPFWRQLFDGCDDVSEQTGLFEDNCLMDVMMFQNKQAFWRQLFDGCDDVSEQTGTVISSLKTRLWWMWWCFRTNRPFWNSLWLRWSVEC